MFRLYTIGHSNQSQEDFLEMLRQFDINCLIDVRSVPYSKHVPQFNGDVLSVFLKHRGIVYAHFGKEFGARRDDCLAEITLIRNGSKVTREQVNFENAVRTTQFLLGATRLTKALGQGRTVTLMCSEANPLECHRFAFLSRYFYEQGWEVLHIVRDTTTSMAKTVSHADLEKEMITTYVSHHKLHDTANQEPSLFGDEYTQEQQRIDAYRLKNHEIGYCVGEEDNN